MTMMLPTTGTDYMKTLLALVSIALSVHQTSPAQIAGIAEYSLHGGMAFPVGPAAFYDYWKPGLAVGGALGFPLMKSFSIQAGVDYAAFSMDADRFLKGIKRDPKDNSISGGNSTFLMFSGSLRFLPAENQPLPLFLAGGVHLLVSSVAQSRGNFSGYEVIQSRETYASGGFSFGGGVDVPVKPAMNMFLEARYLFAIVRSSRANTNASLLRAGVRVQL